MSIKVKERTLEAMYEALKKVGFQDKGKVINPHVAQYVGVLKGYNDGLTFQQKARDDWD